MFAGVALPPGSAPRAKFENSSVRGFLNCGENRRIGNTRYFRWVSQLRRGLNVCLAPTRFCEPCTVRERGLSLRRRYASWYSLSWNWQWLCGRFRRFHTTLRCQLTRVFTAHWEGAGSILDSRLIVCSQWNSRAYAEAAIRGPTTEYDAFGVCYWELAGHDWLLAVDLWALMLLCTVFPTISLLRLAIRRRFQFSVRTLVLLVSAIAFFLGAWSLTKHIGTLDVLSHVDSLCSKSRQCTCST